MIIAIPSKGRAGKTKTAEFFYKNGVLFVPENEVDSYRKVHQNNIVGVPVGVRGITATRNWILNNVDEKWVVMVDDDLKVQGWTKLFSHYARKYPLTEDEWFRECVRLFDMCQELKFRIWGVNTEGNLYSVYPYRPFIFHTYVTGSFMGIRNDSGIRFDENFPVKEDYEICLRCIKEDGGVLGARYIYWVNDHWEKDGGCKDYRTDSMEENAIKKLMEMYPGRIGRIYRKSSKYTIKLKF